MNDDLTTRDKFALAALSGLLAAESDDAGRGAIRHPEPGQSNLCRKPATYATLAYQLADAMIAARAAK